MKLNLKNLMAIALAEQVRRTQRTLWVIALSLAIALTPFNSALAGTVKSNAADTAKQAAEEVVKDTGVKQQFGKTESGDRLLDKAQEKANEKLNDLAEKADSEPELAPSEKLFLKNFPSKS